MVNIQRAIFFDNQVHMKEWKDSMASSFEDKVISIIESCGFILGKDFQRQYPLGERMVIDIAFPNERVAIEVDGRSHGEKKQKIKDKKNDRWLYGNGWDIIRIPHKKFLSRPLYYEYLIRDIINQRRIELHLTYEDKTMDTGLGLCTED